MFFLIVTRVIVKILYGLCVNFKSSQLQRVQDKLPDQLYPQNCSLLLKLVRRLTPNPLKFRFLLPMALCLFQFLVSVVTRSL